MTALHSSQKPNDVYCRHQSLFLVNICFPLASKADHLGFLCNIQVGYLSKVVSKGVNPAKVINPIKIINVDELLTDRSPGKLCLDQHKGYPSTTSAA
ncbi:hypothetical protein AAES_133275 [Amazona aestiva]|uniref:Uncharacterized protein n=1 Tax=Amazona aestiva TaxID=12930 RepID=A0A0Q3M2G3_AMAAE|nr:hypothetical protein AAES_133275 [Amazona aestiva]